jgi:hypothetical protein
MSTGTRPGHIRDLDDYTRQVKSVRARATKSRRSRLPLAPLFVFDCQDCTAIARGPTSFPKTRRPGPPDCGKHVSLMKDRLRDVIGSIHEEAALTGGSRV